MSFFHRHGYEQAVAALQAEMRAEADRITAKLKVAADDREAQRLRQELGQVEARFRDRQRHLLHCLF